MSTTELKEYIDSRTIKERNWMNFYLLEFPF